MTNEEKVNQYKEEIENVFRTGKAMNKLIAYDRYNNDPDKAGRHNVIIQGLPKGEYWLKLDVQEQNPLNSFLETWLLLGKRIAGVRVNDFVYGEIYSKDELKDKLLKMINE